MVEDASSQAAAQPPAAAAPAAAAPAAAAPPKAKPWERGALPLAPATKPTLAAAAPAAAPSAPPAAASCPVDPSVAQAVRFISNAAVQHTSAEQKRAFLLSKGLTEAQIDQAFAQAGARAHPPAAAATAAAAAAATPAAVGQSAVPQSSLRLAAFGAACGTCTRRLPRLASWRAT